MGYYNVRVYDYADFLVDGFSVLYEIDQTAIKQAINSYASRAHTKSDSTAHARNSVCLLYRNNNKVLSG